MNHALHGVNMGRETKRLFIAIGLPADIRKKLDDLENELKRFARDAKWAKAEGIHLTLKFLGSVESARILSIQEALAPAGKMYSPFQIELKGCGFFPNSRRPNVLWTGVLSQHLLPLQQQVEEMMAQLGFEKEKRDFSPHLTLARFREPQGLLPLAQEIEKRKDATLGDFVAEAFSLYESMLRPQGAEYRTLTTVPLAGAL